MNNKGLQLVHEQEQLLIQGLRGNEEVFNRLLQSKAFMTYKNAACEDSLVTDFVNVSALVNMGKVNSISSLVEELKSCDLDHLWSLAPNFLELVRITLVHSPNSALAKRALQQ